MVERELKVASDIKGRFEIKLDSKGRLNLPSALKSAFPDSSFVVTNSQYQGSRCLDIYPVEEWSVLESKISKMSSLKKEVQAFQRFYIAGGQPMDGDSQGRCLVPRSLRDYAGLTGEMILVGMGNKMELWDLKEWKSIFDTLATDFEDTLAAIADLDMSA